MSCRILIIALFCFSISASKCVGGGLSAIDRLLEDVLATVPISSEKQWQRWKLNEFPRQFLDPDLEYNSKHILLGYKLNKIRVIAEIEKPYMNTDMSFCRSRINVYIFPSYVDGVNYKDQTKFTFIDVSEFIKFNDLKSKICSIDKLEEFSDEYTYVDGKYDDATLLRIKKYVESKEGQTKLYEIGVTRSKAFGKHNSYYVYVGRDSERIKKILIEGEI